MIDQVLSALSTIAWLVFTVCFIVLFGRTEGGGWSIAGGVARGVREWSRERRAAQARSSSPFSGPLAPMQIPDTIARHPAATAESVAGTGPASETSATGPAATVEELGDRPIR